MISNYTAELNQRWGRPEIIDKDDQEQREVMLKQIIVGQVSIWVTSLPHILNLHEALQGQDSKTWGMGKSSDRTECLENSSERYFTN